MINITNNLVFAHWDRVFRDQMATAAAIDRLVHHAVLLECAREERLAAVFGRPAVLR